jgi:hypothetical protein
MSHGAAEWSNDVIRCRTIRKGKDKRGKEKGIVRKREQGEKK